MQRSQPPIVAATSQLTNLTVPVTIGTPGLRRDEDLCEQNAFRPTNLMQRVSEVIEQHSGELTKNQVAKRVGGRRESTLMAIDVLVFEGYVISAKGWCGYEVLILAKRYREKDDE